MPAPDHAQFRWRSPVTSPPAPNSTETRWPPAGATTSNPAGREHAAPRGRRSEQRNRERVVVRRRRGLDGRVARLARFEGEPGCSARGAEAGGAAGGGGAAAGGGGAAAAAVRRPAATAGHRRRADRGSRARPAARHPRRYGRRARSHGSDRRPRSSRVPRRRADHADVARIADPLAQRADQLRAGERHARSISTAMRASCACTAAVLPSTTTTRLDPPQNPTRPISRQSRPILENFLCRRGERRSTDGRWAMGRARSQFRSLAGRA